MKKIFCTLALSIMALSAFSQDIKFGYGQVLYHIPNPNIVYNVRQRVPWNGVIQTVNVVPVKWKVVKFVNMGDQITKNYDAMIVQTSGKFKNLERRTYLVRYQDLSDEHKKIIDNANHLIDSEFVDAKNQIAYNLETIEDSLKFYRVKRDSVINEIEAESLNRIYQIQNERDSLIKLAVAEKEAELYKKEAELKSTLTQKQKDILNHIDILNISLNTDSAGGNDVNINWRNTGVKDIKYAYFTIDFYNAVDDKVRCTISGESSKLLKATGWINVEETKYHSWDHILYNYSAEYFVIKNIKFIYKDGSTYSVALTKKEFQDLYNYSQECKNIARNWQSTIAAAKRDVELTYAEYITKESLSSNAKSKEYRDYIVEKMAELYKMKNNYTEKSNEDNYPEVIVNENWNYYLAAWQPKR